MTTSKVLLLFLLLVLNSGCEFDLHPETIVRGQVILNGSDEPISNAAIIIRQIQVYNSLPQNDLLISAETILCDEEGNFEYTFGPIDSANGFTIVAALWDPNRDEYVGQNTLCRIGDWMNCSGNAFGEVYDNYILEIYDWE